MNFSLFQQGNDKENLNEKIFKKTKIHKLIEFNDGQSKFGSENPSLTIIWCFIIVCSLKLFSVYDVN